MSQSREDRSIVATLRLMLPQVWQYRGRVLSVLFLSRGMNPLGTMLAGFGTAVFGVQLTTGIMAAGLVLIALLAGRWAPVLRGLR